MRFNEDGLWADAFRRSPARLGGRGGYKEWQHFLLHTRDVHLLANFNLIDAPWGDRRDEETGRLIVLARRDGWDGDVDEFDADALSVTAGSIDARFGRNSLRFDGRRYHVDIALARRPVRASLAFTPRSKPAVSWHQPLSADKSLSWLFMPRLAASGWVTVGDARFEVEDAPAYHDHNWGHFRWGDDFSWEWGSALSWDPACPWSAVYMRMADRRRARVLCQGLYLWRGAEHRRIFRDEQLRVEWDGPWRGGRALKVPRVMGLLSPGEGGDLPRVLTVRAGEGADEVTLRFAPVDAAEVVMPSEAATGAVAALHECWGEATLTGEVGGERVALEGPGVFEFVRD